MVSSNRAVVRMRGTLFLIVGPSGAGKDTLIKAARPLLGPRFLFPPRTITREAGPGEDHEPASLAAFEARERAGHFALSWRAHGLCYGITMSIAGALRDGDHVVVNVSRAVVTHARARFAPVRVILVTAPAEALRARLLARGREAAEDVAARLDRAAAVDADATIVNDGAPEPAVAAFVAALQG